MRIQLGKHQKTLLTICLVGPLVASTFYLFSRREVSSPVIILDAEWVSKLERGRQVRLEIVDPENPFSNKFQNVARQIGSRLIYPKDLAMSDPAFGEKMLDSNGKVLRDSSGKIFLDKDVKREVVLQLNFIGNVTTNGNRRVYASFYRL